MNWVAVSPSQAFTPGEATGFVLGRDELLVAPDGSSHVSTGTMAVAILNEIEHPAHVRERFTVRDAEPPATLVAPIRTGLLDADLSR